MITVDAAVHDVLFSWLQHDDKDKFAAAVQPCDKRKL